MFGYCHDDASSVCFKCSLSDTAHDEYCSVGLVIIHSLSRRFLIFVSLSWRDEWVDILCNYLVHTSVNACALCRSCCDTHILKELWNNVEQCGTTMSKSSSSNKVIRCCVMRNLLKTCLDIRRLLIILGTHDPCRWKRCHGETYVLDRISLQKTWLKNHLSHCRWTSVGRVCVADHASLLHWRVHRKQPMILDFAFLIKGLHQHEVFPRSDTGRSSCCCCCCCRFRVVLLVMLSTLHWSSSLHWLNDCGSAHVYPSSHVFFFGVSHFCEMLLKYFWFDTTFATFYSSVIFCISNSWFRIAFCSHSSHGSRVFSTSRLSTTSNTVCASILNKMSNVMSVSAVKLLILTSGDPCSWHTTLLHIHDNVTRLSVEL